MLKLILIAKLNARMTFLQGILWKVVVFHRTAVAISLLIFMSQMLQLLPDFYLLIF